jgi:uncharacterized membrane protein YdjX (TVP38/TMEM64 family)
MEHKQQGKRTAWMRVGILLLAVVAVVLVFRLTPLSVSNFTPERIRLYILSFGLMAPAVFVVVYSLRAVILVLPVGVMSLAGGLIFGQWWGALYIIIGATIGSCLSFLIARYFGRSFIESRGWLQKGRMKTLDEGIERNGFRFVIFTRLIPLFQYDAVNFGLGLTKVPFRQYAIGTLIGMIPGGFINAFLGSSLDNIISTQFFLALGLFVLLMFVPLIYKKVKDARGARAPVARVAHEAKSTRGECPDCGGKIGPLASLVSWDNWGKFVCPGCGNTIGFRAWLLAVVTLMLLMVGVERLLHAFLVTDVSLWLSFSAAFILSLLVMFLVPMIWPFKAES